MNIMKFFKMSVRDCPPGFRKARAEAVPISITETNKKRRKFVLPTVKKITIQIPAAPPTKINCLKVKGPIIFALRSINCGT